MPDSVVIGGPGGHILEHSGEHIRADQERSEVRLVGDVLIGSDDSVGQLEHLATHGLGLCVGCARWSESSRLVGQPRIKVLGGLYLIVLGVRTLVSARCTAPTAELVERGDRELFIEGFVINLLNPRVALFFLAFLPQFIDVDSGRAISMVRRGDRKLDHYVESFDRNGYGRWAIELLVDGSLQSSSAAPE